jgi:hypothetical protein
MKKASISLLLLFLSGCILPYPHYNWKTPEYTGVVSDERGDPLQGVDVYLENAPDRKVKTDEKGKFILPPIKEFELTALICPGPCDTIPAKLNLIARAENGEVSVSEVYTCLGHPSSQCNGRSTNVYIRMEKSHNK